jgi:hypothetical protein
MSIDRRVSAESRRRRVIYQTGREHTTETAAERRAAEKLREARRPAANYGSHVNRRLRGRWFSLVPVRRRTLAACGAVILGSAMLLAMMHWLAVSWAPLSTNAELARPLRLDRPDSLGNWAKTFFLAAASGTALLVYQLRRYKVDDYKGHYRLWRPVIVLLGVMSLDSVCDLVPWLGAMIDALLGRRMAFSGADWIRIVMTVGGGALALRLVAEVWRSKLSLCMMLAAIVGFALPMSARWNLLDANTVTGWLTVTTSPLLAAAALWISIGSYLRMLFREVRGLDHAAAVAEAMSVEKPKVKKSVGEPEVTDERRGWFSRRSAGQVEGQGSKPRSTPVSKSTRALPKDAPESSAQVALKERTSSRDSEDVTTDAKVSGSDVKAGATKRRWKLPFIGNRADKAGPEQKASETTKEPAKAKPTVSASDEKRSAATTKEDPKPKRRWLGLRSAAVAAKNDAQDDKSVAASKVVTKPTEPKPEATTKAKGSWFSWGRSKEKPEGSERAEQSKPTPVTASKVSTPAPKATEAESKPERKGLGGWLRRDGASPPSAAKPPSDKPVVSAKPSNATNEDDDEEGDIDDDSVDWSAMNKSERRRMRKEIKRGGKAA